MSAIIGRIQFDKSIVDPVIFAKAFESISHYGKDGANYWINHNIALGQHLLKVTPESFYESQPYQWENATVIADARIDNRNQLCDYFSISNIERLTIPDSQLIVRAYRHWGEECTSYLLGDFVFAIWDNLNETLFCAKDHIGTRPFYYYYDQKSITFATDIEALKVFPDVDVTIDEFEVAQYLIWPKFPKERTFFKHIYMLPFAHQMRISQDSLQLRCHWNPEDAPDIRYSKTEDYIEHFSELLSHAVACRVRTNYKISSHVSGGIDSSGVTVFANRELLKTGRKLDMTYTWSPPKSEDYPPLKNDERNRIEALCQQEGIFCHYNTSTGKDYREFLARDIAVESTADLFEELPSMLHAKNHEIRVMLSGWGGDEAASFNGRGYFAYLLRRGRLIDLLKVIRENAGGLRRVGNVSSLFFYEALVPQFPDWLYNRFDQTRWTKVFNSYASLALSELFEKKNTVFRNPYRIIPNPRDVQCKLLNNGHISDRMITWSHWSAFHSLVYHYPLTDKRILEFAIGLTPDLLYQKGQWRYLSYAAIRKAIPFTPKKYDDINELKRSRIRLECWSSLRKEVIENKLDLSACKWINYKILKDNIIAVPEKITIEDTISFLPLTNAVRAYHLWEKYIK